MVCIVLVGVVCDISVQLYTLASDQTNDSITTRPLKWETCPTHHCFNLVGFLGCTK